MNVVSVPRMSVPLIDTVGGSPLPTVGEVPPKEVLLSKLTKLDCVVAEPLVKEANGPAPVLVMTAPSAMLKGGASGLMNVASAATRYGPASESDVRDWPTRENIRSSEAPVTDWKGPPV